MKTANKLDRERYVEFWEFPPMQERDKVIYDQLSDPNELLELIYWSVRATDLKNKFEELRAMTKDELRDRYKEARSRKVSTKYPR